MTNAVKFEKGLFRQLNAHPENTDAYVIRKDNGFWALGGIGVIGDSTARQQAYLRVGPDHRWSRKALTSYLQLDEIFNERIYK